jgi:hypothetical protein
MPPCSPFAFEPSLPRSCPSWISLRSSFDQDRNIVGRGARNIVGNDRADRCLLRLQIALRVPGLVADPPAAGIVIVEMAMETGFD